MRHRLPWLVLALVVVLVVGGLIWWQQQRRPAFVEATSMAPAGSQRLLWVDWARVRTEVEADADADSSAGAVRELLDKAFERDLSAPSALGESAVELHVGFGLSPATVSWELFAQGPDGAAELLGVPEEFDFDELAARLEEAGFEPPEDEDGIWRGGPDLLARIGAQLTPELAYLALDRDRGLVATSDSAAYLERAVAASRGEGDTVSGLEEVVEASGTPTAALVYDGAYTCERLAMAQADDTDRATADQLLAEAGEVNPMTSFALSLQPDGQARVAMGFENDDQARTNADTRAQLAVGPAPGQGGDFTDRFRLESAVAEGSTVVLDLTPETGSYPLSDLGSGPVLFATC